MSAPPTERAVRLAELIAMISLGTDLGMGQPMEHVMRQSLIALRLAERLGLDEAARRSCTTSACSAGSDATSTRTSRRSGSGTTMALKADVRRVDMAGAAGAGVRRAPPRRRPRAGRARPAGRAVRRRTGRRAADEMIENHWLATNELAAALGLGPEVRDGLYQTFERWDGKGVPAEARGEEILIAARLVTLADVVEVFHRSGGVDAAVAVARERSGTQFDPALVDVFCAEAPDAVRRPRRGDDLARR